MDGPDTNDPDIESAKKDLTQDAPSSGDKSSGQKPSGEGNPTVEQQGTMTPGKDAVEDANASGVNPNKQ